LSRLVFFNVIWNTKVLICLLTHNVFSIYPKDWVSGELDERIFTEVQESGKKIGRMRESWVEHELRMKKNICEQIEIEDNENMTPEQKAELGFEYTQSYLKEECRSIADTTVQCHFFKVDDRIFQKLVDMLNTETMVQRRMKRIEYRQYERKNI